MVFIWADSIDKFSNDLMHSCQSQNQTLVLRRILNETSAEDSAESILVDCHPELIDNSIVGLNYQRQKYNNHKAIITWGMLLCCAVYFNKIVALMTWRHADKLNINSVSLYDIFHNWVGILFTAFVLMTEQC